MYMDDMQDFWHATPIKGVLRSPTKGVATLSLRTIVLKAFIKVCYRPATRKTENEGWPVHICTWIHKHLHVYICIQRHPFIHMRTHQHKHTDTHTPSTLKVKHTPSSLEKIFSGEMHNSLFNEHSMGAHHHVRLSTVCTYHAFLEFPRIFPSLSALVKAPILVWMCLPSCLSL